MLISIFFLISKKTNLHVQHAFCLFLPLFCTTTMLFCRTKTSNFLVCGYPIFCLRCSCSLLFFTAAYFHLAGRQHFSFSHRRFEFPCFCSNEFSITRSSFFSVIHLSVHMKNNAEKRHNFFLSTSPFGHVISLQIKP